ncbi:MAG: hypothetical protein NTV80_06810 [Verrucomicrobia bacterium]|nr:hypothetical protein [Verrucomicrobiota bacterium]
MTAAASLAWHRQDKLGALNLLHRAIPTEIGQTRSAAQMLYVRAALFPGLSQQDMSIPPRAPSKQEASQLERVKAIFEEWLPMIREHRVAFSGYPIWKQALDAVGLVDEAAKLAQPNNASDARRYSGRWQEPDSEFFGRRRRFDGQFQRPEQASYYIDSSQRMSPEMRTELALRWVAGLRRSADQRFLGWRSGNIGSSELENIRRQVKQNNLAAAMLQAVEPGRVRSWRALIQAVHVADACGEWQRAHDWLKEALPLRAADAVMNATLLRLEMHLGAKPEALSAALQRLPNSMAAQTVGLLAQEARGLSKYEARLNLVEACVRAAQSQPNLLTASELSTWLRPAENLCSALVDSFSSSEMQVLTLFQETESRQPEKPAPEALLTRRKALHDQLCTLLIQQTPPQAGNVLQQLTQRHLLEGKPASEEFIAWLKNTETRDPAQDLLGMSHSIRRVPERLRLARLIMALRADEDTQPGIQNRTAYGRDQVLELIGAEISDNSNPVMNALWEWPFPITSGTQKHTAEQLVWQEERAKLFEEYCLAEMKLDSHRAQVFPHYAGWALHDQAHYAEVLRQARLLYVSKPTAPASLRPLVEMLGRSYYDDHHVRTGELIATLLDEMKPEPTMVAEIVKPVINLLIKGRDNEAERMPSITLSPEAVAKLTPPFSSDLQRRRLAAYERLLHWLGEKLDMPPHELFSQLGQTLRNGQDTEAIEKKLIAAAGRDREEMEKALVEFIEKGHGTQDTTGRAIQGIAWVGGVWDPDLRYRWYAAAWRVGKTMLEGVIEQNPVWLNRWLGNLLQPNSGVTPSIPPIFGMEGGHGYDQGFTGKFYASVPALKLRDDLFLQVLQVCMDQRLEWRTNFLRYLEMQAWKSPQSHEAVAAVVRARLPEQPNEVAEAVESWQGWADDGGSPQRREFMALLGETLISHWPPAQEMSDTNSTAGRFDRILLRLDFGTDQRFVMLERFPGEAQWNYEGRFKSSSRVMPIDLGFRSRWYAIQEMAVQKSGLLNRFFRQYARVHVEASPEKVVSAALRFMQHPEADNLFPWSFQDIFQNDESRAPVSRRNAWARMALMMISKCEPAHAAKSSKWVAEIVKFVSADPSRNSQNSTLKPTLEDLATREQLLTQLRSETRNYPALIMETFATQAIAQMKAGAPVASTLEIARKLMSKDAEGLGQQLDAFFQADIWNEINPAQATWAVELLMPLAETWPESGRAPYWLRGFSRLFYQMHHNSGSTGGLLQRFLTIVFKQDVSLQASCLAASGYAISNEPKVQDWLVSQLTARLKAEGSEQLEPLLSYWWRQGAGSLNPGNCDAAQVPLKLLQVWPADADVSTLSWIEPFLVQLSKVNIRGEEPFLRVMRDTPVTSLGIPNDPKAALIFKTALKEVQSRKVKFPALQLTLIRAAAATETTFAERQRDLAPYFKPPHLAETKAWIQRSLKEVITLSNDMRMGVIPEGRSADDITREMLDVCRAAHTAVTESWLPAEEAAELRTTIPKQLQILLRESQKTKRSHFEQKISASMTPAIQKVQKLWD